MSIARWPRGRCRARSWRCPGGRDRSGGRGRRRWREGSPDSRPSWSCRRRLSGSRRRSSAPLSDPLGLDSRRLILPSTAGSPRYHSLGRRANDARGSSSGAYRGLTPDEQSVSRETRRSGAAVPGQGPPRPGIRRTPVSRETPSSQTVLPCEGAARSALRCPFWRSVGYSAETSPPYWSRSTSRAGGRATFSGRFAEETTRPMTLLLAAVGAVVTALIELTVVPYLRIGSAQPHPVLVLAVIVTIAIGVEAGLVWAFVGGLALDVLAQRPLGSTAFALLLCVGATAILSRGLVAPSADRPDRRGLSRSASPIR